MLVVSCFQKVISNVCALYPGNVKGGRSWAHVGPLAPRSLTIFDSENSGIAYTNP